MENNSEQIKNINVSKYDIALCNGTIEEKLQELSDAQLEYLEALVELDETLDDKIVLLEYIGLELRKRITKSKTSNEDLSVNQLIEKVTKSIIEGLESIDNKDIIVESIHDTDTFLLRNIKYHISCKELTQKRIFIKDTVDNELSLREEVHTKKYTL